MIHLSQGWVGAGLGPHSRHNSYSSHTSRITYNSHGELTGMLQSSSCRPPAFLASRWSHWVQGVNTNNDVPYSQSNGGGHNGVCLRMKDTAATMKSSLVTGDRTGDSVTPSKQRLSVQFPVRMDSDLRLVYFTLSLVTNDTILAKALLSSMQMI